jgi:hypothetical protein
MDSDSSPQGVSIYCWFSFQPAKSPLTLCTQGVEGGELTGYWPTGLTCHVDSSVGLGPWEITELAFPKATSAPTTDNYLLLSRTPEFITGLHTYAAQAARLNCYFHWKGFTVRRELKITLKSFSWIFENEINSDTLAMDLASWMTSNQDIFAKLLNF